MEKLNLRLFFTPNTDAGSFEVNPVNVTTQTGTGKDMSPTMKVFYDTYLLENARENMIFDQFGDQQPIHGNSCEWRKFNTFDKATTPLTEGVIPTGKNFGMTKITVETNQYGDYTAISDRLELESVDDVIMGATEEMGAAGAATYDILTRDVLFAGNSVAYAAASRSALNKSAVLTPTLVNKAATWLKKNNAPKINGKYVAIIHPSVSFDLRESADWKDVHKYADVMPIFKGEIGELHGVRFIESNNAKVIDGNAITADKSAVYATLFLGAKAYGIVKPDGESMEMIIKDRHTAGGPLDQFSTIGYKFNHAAKILYQERMLRIETGSSFGDVDEAN